MIMQLEISPELEKGLTYWAKQSKETNEELAVRLIAEYIEDCDDLELYCKEKGTSVEEYFSTDEVRAELGLDN